MVKHPSSADPKKQRGFVIISRQILIDSQFSTVVCAPVYSAYHGLSTQVEVGIEEGLKHVSAIHCDELVSLPKTRLTNFVGRLSDEKLRKMNQALKMALDIL